MRAKEMKKQACDITNKATLSRLAILREKHCTLCMLTMIHDGQLTGRVSRCKLSTKSSLSPLWQLQGESARSRRRRMRMRRRRKRRRERERERKKKKDEATKRMKRNCPCNKRRIT